MSELILKGEEFSPAEPITCSFAAYLFGRLREANPDSVALVEVDSGRTLSFDQLMSQVQSVAAGLRDVGLLPGDVVAVVSYNSLESYVVTLASIFLVAVVAMVHLYPNPDDTMALLRLVDPNLVFTEDGETLTRVVVALSLFPPPHCPKLVVNSSAQQTQPHLTYQQLLNDGVEFQPSRQFYDPTNPILLLFTSGTSGTSKAVVIPERYYMTDKLFLESGFAELSASYRPTVMSTSPCYWSSALHSVFTGISLGNPTAFFSRPASEADIIDGLHKYEISILKLSSPALMEMLHWHPKPRCKELAVIFTGAVVSKEALIKIRDEVFGGKVTLLQGYGMTEAGGLARNAPHKNRIGSVGTIAFNCQLKVVEEGTGRLLGPNQKGEIYIRNNRMMLGYHGYPEDTGNCFDKKGFFNSGDVGFYDEDGFIFISGKKNDLIKWNCTQVSPAEVEAQLVADVAVKAAVVVGLPHAVHGHLVTAAVILNPGYEHTDPTEVESRVNDTLSLNTKIRGGVHFFLSFPHNPTGKLMRQTIVEVILNRVKENVESIQT